MRRIGMRRAITGGALLIAVGVVSVSAVAFVGRDDTSSGSGSGSDSVSATARSRSTTTSSSTTTSTTTTTTTTTTPPPPAPTAAPAAAPAPAPAPAPSAAPPPAPVSSCDGSGGAVVAAMNGDRAANGLGPLCGNGQLSGIAQNWANWMAANGSLTHQDLNGVIGSTGFSAMGENILVGPSSLSVGQMEAAWMASPEHRANILSGAYSAAGVGIAYSSDGRVWVAVDFGG